MIVMVDDRTDTVSLLRLSREDLFMIAGGLFALLVNKQGRRRSMAGTILVSRVVAAISSMSRRGPNCCGVSLLRLDWEQVFVLNAALIQLLFANPANKLAAELFDCIEPAMNRICESAEITEDDHA
jgi:hypothetical protein